MCEAHVGDGGEENLGNCKSHVSLLCDKELRITVECIVVDRGPFFEGSSMEVSLFTY